MFSDKVFKKKIFDLTLAVYRVTARFPEREVLRYRTRDRANEILEDFIFYAHLHDEKVMGRRDFLIKIIAKIHSLQSLFKMARHQQYVNELNFDILDWEYRQIIEACERDLLTAENNPHEERPRPEKKISDGVSNILTGEKPMESLGGTISSLSGRQRDLLGFLKNSREARLKEIVGIFPDLSEKTVRNDLKVLCEKNLIQLNGVAPQSFYSLR